MINLIIRHLFLPLLLLFLSTAGSPVCSQNPLVNPTHPDKVRPKPRPKNTTELSISGKNEGHDYVDLGFPSGVKWATCNIGSSRPEQYGNHYAWGETQSKSSYTEDNSTSYGKPMGDISCSYLYDAARSSWGGAWRLPSRKDIQELLDNSDYKWLNYNGVGGILFTSRINGKTIFFPSSGIRNGSSYSNSGSAGFYWSSSPDDSGDGSAFYLGFDQYSAPWLRWQQRNTGLSLRAVFGEEQEIQDYTVTSSVSGSIAGYDYVDLGLPSGLKWATCNVGASNSEDYGDYYAWGETSTKSEYTDENSYTYNKKDIGDISGLSNYDAARYNWGGSWRIPTLSEIEELCKNCDYKWTNYKGKTGCLFTSKKNGKKLFLPAAGYCYGTSLCYAGEYGVYWSSSPNEDNDYYAFSLYFFASGNYWYGWYNRCYGLSVRPVSE